MGDSISDNDFNFGNSVPVGAVHLVRKRIIAITGIVLVLHIKYTNLTASLGFVIYTFMA
jgi:hypothetical protein